MPMLSMCWPSVGRRVVAVVHYSIGRIFLNILQCDGDKCRRKPINMSCRFVSVLSNRQKQNRNKLFSSLLFICTILIKKKTHDVFAFFFLSFFLFPRCCYCFEMTYVNEQKNNHVIVIVKQLSQTHSHTSMWFSYKCFLTFSLFYLKKKIFFYMFLKQTKNKIKYIV